MKTIILIIEKMAANINMKCLLTALSQFIASFLMVSKYKQRFSEQQLFVSSTRAVMSNIYTAGSFYAEGEKHRGCELNDNDKFRWMDLVFQKHNPSR